MAVVPYRRCLVLFLGPSFEVTLESHSLLRPASKQLNDHISCVDTRVILYYPGTRNKFSMVVNLIDKQKIADVVNEKCTVLACILHSFVIITPTTCHVLSNGTRLSSSSLLQ